MTEVATEAKLNLLPQASKDRYERNLQVCKVVTENSLIVYFGVKVTDSRCKRKYIIYVYRVTQEKFKPQSFRIFELAIDFKFS